MIAEEIRNRSVASGEIVQGTKVVVYTRMGRIITEGQASYPMPAGLCIEGQFYASNLYLFVITDAAQARALDEARKGVVRDGKAAKAGKLHPDNLPDVVRKAITTTADMSDSQLHRVLGEVGDAALRILRKVGVREDEVYGKVERIQKAVLGVLKDEFQDEKEKNKVKDTDAD